MDEEARQQQLKEMALDMSVPLYRRYSEKDAAQLLDVSVPTLKRLRANGKIAYLRVSQRKIAFFGYQILEHLLNSVEMATCPNTARESSNSATTGSQSKPEAMRGAGRGLTQKLDKQDALASAQRILGKPKKG